MVARRRGTRLYLAALITAQGTAFARSIVLARLLGPEQMGLAAIIIVTGQFFDSITDTANDKFLIQDRYGDSPEALRLVQLVAVIKGFITALLLVVLAEPIARFTGAPQTAGALVVLAIVPLVNGFTNYDFRVAQRHHRFDSEAKVMWIAEVSALVATAIAAFVLRDFTAVLYGLAARALASVLVSQAVASRPYGLRYSSAVARRLWKYAAPLVSNGVLIFLATQSDRVIISRSLGLAELGRYSVILLLGLYPALTLMRFAGAIFLPAIAATRDDAGERRRVVDQLDGVMLLIAVGLAVGFSFVIPPLLPIVFGQKFASTTLLVTLLGLVTSWRMLKTGPTTTAVATGHTRIITTNNVLRLIGIAAAIAGLHFIGGLPGVAAGLIAGEIVANAIASAMVNKAMGWGWAAGLARYGLAIAVGILLVVYAYASDHHDRGIAFAAGAASLVAMAGAVWFERETVTRVIKLARHSMKI